MISDMFGYFGKNNVWKHDFTYVNLKWKSTEKLFLIVQIIHYFSRKYIFDNYRTFHNFRAQNLHWKSHKMSRIYVIFVKVLMRLLKRYMYCHELCSFRISNHSHTMSGWRNFWTLQKKSTLDEFYVKFTKLTNYLSHFHFTHCTYVVTLL